MMTERTFKILVRIVAISIAGIVFGMVTNELTEPRELLNTVAIFATIAGLITSMLVAALVEIDRFLSIFQ